MGEKEREVEDLKGKAPRNRHQWGPQAVSEVWGVCHVVCRARQLRHQVTDAAVLGSAVTPSRRSRCHICPQESLPAEQHDASRGTHSFPDWLHLLLWLSPKGVSNSAAAIATQSCDLSPKLVHEGKPAVLGPFNSTALVLWQDTASDGPGVNGRVEDPMEGSQQVWLEAGRG